MRHERSIDLVQDDMFDPASGRVGGFTISELFEAAAAYKHVRFSHIPAAWSMGVKCWACGRVVPLDRWKLERQVGSNALVSETGRRLRCRKCGVRGSSWFQFWRQQR